MRWMVSKYQTMREGSGGLGPFLSALFFPPTMTILGVGDHVPGQGSTFPAVRYLEVEEDYDFLQMQ